MLIKYDIHKYANSAVVAHLSCKQAKHNLRINQKIVTNPVVASNSTMLTASG